VAHPSNVVQVDFRARALTPEENSLDELKGLARQLVLADPLGGADLLSEMIGDNHDEAAMWEKAWKEAAGEACRLRRELRQREYAGFAFTDQDVLAAMPAGRVRACVLATRMFPSMQVPHGIVVRIGHALGRLERDGRTRRHPRGASMWDHASWEAVSV